MIGKFDVIVSIGVLEHFENTQQVLEAFSRFLKPSGLMVTLIPNMVGLVGFLHKIINRPVYDIHVPLSREQLLAAHQTVGLEILDGQYFLFTNFGVINLVGISPRTFAGFIRRGILFGLNRLSAASWFIEERVAKFKPNWLTSPYVICLARKTSP